MRDFETLYVTIYTRYLHLIKKIYYS